MEKRPRSEIGHSIAIVAAALLSAVATELVVAATAIMTTMLARAEVVGSTVFWISTAFLTPLAAIVGGLLAALRPRRTFLPLFASAWIVAVALETALGMGGLRQDFGLAIAGLAACLLFVPTSAAGVYALMGPLTRPRDSTPSGTPGIVATALLSTAVAGVIGVATTIITFMGIGPLALIVAICGAPLAGVIGGLLAALRPQRTLVSAWVTAWAIACLATVGLGAGAAAMRPMMMRVVSAAACLLLLPASATAVYALTQRPGRRSP